MVVSRLLIERLKEISIMPTIENNELDRKDPKLYALYEINKEEKIKNYESHKHNDYVPVKSINKPKILRHRVSKRGI